MADPQSASAAASEPTAPLPASAGWGEGFTSGRAWYVAVVLMVASTISVVDRQIMALMIGPIKRDFGLSDAQVGLLIGLTFAAVYSLTAIPMGVLADRKDRRRIIAYGMMAWSAMTALCGWARTSTELVLARMGVGIGEAALGPAAISLLSDIFPRVRLPLAIAIFSCAPFVGVGLANILGGPLVQALEQTPTLVLPLVGETRSWQAVFYIIGLPGIVLALFMFSFPEPFRRPSAMSESILSDKVPLRQAISFMSARWQLFVCHFTAIIMLSVMGWGLFAWVVEFLVRNHGMEKREAGVIYGLIALTFGIVGSLASGWYTTHLTKRGSVDAPLRIIMWIAVLLTPAAILMPLSHAAWLAIVLLCPLTFFMAFPSGPAVVTLEAVTPSELRGQVVAIYLFIVNFAGISLGPLAVGLLTTYVYGETGTHLAIATMAATLYPIAALALALSLPYLRKHRAEAEAWHGHAPLPAELPGAPGAPGGAVVPASTAP